MPKRDRGSLTDLLAEATGDAAEASTAEAAPEKAPEAKRPAKKGGGEAPSSGHVRESNGSYVRADGSRRVSLQLKMDPDDKRALKVQAASAGLSPAEYVARLVREDRR